MSRLKVFTAPHSDLREKTLQASRATWEQMEALLNDSQRVGLAIEIERNRRGPDGAQRVTLPYDEAQIVLAIAKKGEPIPPQEGAGQ
jgi:hypothetical protein